MRARLVSLILGLVWPWTANAGELEFLGQLSLETEVVAGVSGLELSEDGRRFLAVSDRGWWLEGALERSGDTLTNVTIDRILPILGSDGFPVSARRVADRSDAEGLIVDADGTAWVAFERWAHVALFPDGITGKAKWIKDHPTFYDFAENWQLEAMAQAPDGTIYVFSERPLAEGFPIYRLDGSVWTIDGYLPERDVFSIVGADFDKVTGDLYLLERKLVVGIWWQSRIRRVHLDTGADETLWTSERGDFFNLEGISVWRDAKGLRLTIVSDNNGDRDEPTQFIEFRLTE